MSEAAADELSHSINDIQESPVVQRRNSDNVPELSQEDSIRDILLQMKKLQEDSSRDHLTQMRQLLVQDEIGANLSVKAFDWVACKPTRLFHPVSYHDSCLTLILSLISIELVGAITTRHA
jgi:hypothetical protein